MKMLSPLAVLLLVLSLSGCQWIANHKIHHQQGNVIKDDRVAQLRKGMSPREVAEIMGSPVYDNTFDTNRWVYVHTEKNGNRPMMKRNVVVVFRDGNLSQVIR